MLTDEPPAATMTTVVTSAELSPVETAKLENLEIVIENGLQSFLEVGRALLQIRDERLYRLTHSTFEAYSHERWGMTPQHANRLATAATIVESLEPIGSIPQTESQVRPLAKLPVEERGAAWQEAVEASNGKPTAAVVEKIVANRKLTAKVNWQKLRGKPTAKAKPAKITPPETIIAEKLAAELGITADEVVKSGKFAEAVDALAKSMGGGFRDEILSGKFSVSQEEVIALADQPWKLQTLMRERFAARGDCPRGGNHQWVWDGDDPTDEFCSKCKHPRDAKPEQPDEHFSDLMLETQKILRKLVAKFPAKYREALGNRLVSAGEELKERGDLR